MEDEMNKTAIKNFAVWAREKLISDITYKASMLGITDSGIAEPLPISTNDLLFFDIGTKDYAEVSGNEIKQRKALVDAINAKEKGSKSYKEAFEYIVEEVAYTWFNRLVAIRFMEINDYLPSGIRVLSSENAAKNEPDFVTTPFDTDLEFTPFEQDRVIQLKDENKLDELFRMLFIKQCNKLHEVLPELFEKTDDYSELLLTISFTDTDGIVHHLVHDIDEDDFNVEKEGQVEIIGWMYQYYISKKHEEVIDPLHGKTIKKEDIPAATQLFTTDWVVRYMVDNSLGRYWIERNPQSKLAEKLDFFVTPKDGKINYIDEKIYPTDMTFFDPCMGSGHILVYAFDVLMEIYRECGYSDRDAALNIVQNNLYGMDIDKRAYQLAYFAIMMKARSYNRRALTKGISNNLSVVEESNSIDKFICDDLTNDSEQNKIGEYLVDVYRDAQEIGTLQTVEARDYASFIEYLKSVENITYQIEISTTAWINDTLPKMIQLAKQAEIMSEKYAVVCTNPPYMNKLEGQLKKFVVDNYKAYSGDLFSVFMYRNFGYCKTEGYSAFMTPNVWMFIKTYENLRKYIINNKHITTLIQMAKGAFFKEATVDIASFVLKNSKCDKHGLYFRLEDFKGDMEVQKQKVLEALTNKDCGYFYEADQSNFSKIPGSSIAYWVSDAFVKVFKYGKPLEKEAYSFQGIITGNNNYFLRLWHEVSLLKVKVNICNQEKEKFNNAWVPYNKGGGFRRWYGNNEYLLRWIDNGKTLTRARTENSNFYFQEGVTWSFVTSGVFSARYFPQGALWDVAGSSIFATKKLDIRYICALMNSKPAQLFFDITNPTINYQVMNIIALPLLDNIYIDEVVNLSKKCIELSKTDWDSYETSWDFKKHPLLCYGTNTVSSAFENWTNECNDRFNQLKANEEELNRIFIDIYGLQDELTPEVEDKDVTVRKADLQRDIKSLISLYAWSLFT